jgi:hypothetical protein
MKERPPNSACSRGRHPGNWQAWARIVDEESSRPLLPSPVFRLEVKPRITRLVAFMKEA